MILNTIHLIIANAKDFITPHSPPTRKVAHPATSTQSLNTLEEFFRDIEKVTARSSSCNILTSDEGLEPVSRPIFSGLGLGLEHFRGLGLGVVVLVS